MCEISGDTVLWQITWRTGTSAEDSSSSLSLSHIRIKQPLLKTLTYVSVERIPINMTTSVVLSSCALALSYILGVSAAKTPDFGLAILPLPEHQCAGLLG